MKFKVMEYEGWWIVKLENGKFLNPNGKQSYDPIKMNSEFSANYIAIKYGYKGESHGN